jgi:hypothetical protein
MIQAYQITEKQMQNHRIRTQRNVGRDTYEAWYKIELAIRKFDRIFNKVEKYDARKFNDPENHERTSLTSSEATLKRSNSTWTTLKLISKRTQRMTTSMNFPINWILLARVFSTTNCTTLLTPRSTTSLRKTTKTSLRTKFSSISIDRIVILMKNTPEE